MKLTMWNYWLGVLLGVWSQCLATDKILTAEMTTGAAVLFVFCSFLWNKKLLVRNPS